MQAFSAILVILSAFLGLIYFSTQISLFGLPIVTSWSDMAGVFTGAAAFFNGLALIGIFFTLMQQKKAIKLQEDSIKDAKDSLKENLNNQKTAVDELRKTAEGIKNQANATQDQLDLLKESLDLQKAKLELAWLEQTFRFFIDQQGPDEEFFKDASLYDEIKQSDVRKGIPSKWSGALRDLLKELDALKENLELDALKENVAASNAIQQTCTKTENKLKEYISDHHKKILALAELPHEDNIFDDYKPSAFAILLCKYGLFPYLKNTKRETAGKKAYQQTQK